MLLNSYAEKTAMMDFLQTLQLKFAEIARIQSLTVTNAMLRITFSFVTLALPQVAFQKTDLLLTNDRVLTVILHNI